MPNISCVSYSYGFSQGCLTGPCRDSTFIISRPKINSNLSKSSLLDVSFSCRGEDACERPDVTIESGISIGSVNIECLGQGIIDHDSCKELKIYLPEEAFLNELICDFSFHNFFTN